MNTAILPQTIDDYVLPVDKPVYIGQGFNGHSTHKRYVTDLGIIDDSYSLDFILDRGSNLYAARAGEIVKIVVEHSEDDNYFLRENESVDGNRLQNALDKTNAIIIQHDDGTYGFYLHLMENGIANHPSEERKLHVADRVEQGQLIGFSGNTGFSSLPHLHFCIYKRSIEQGVALESVPFKFKNYDETLEDKEIHPHLHGEK